jgi:hypothetical protein
MWSTLFRPKPTTSNGLESRAGKRMSSDISFHNADDRDGKHRRRCAGRADNHVAGELSARSSLGDADLKAPLALRSAVGGLNEARRYHSPGGTDSGDLRATGEDDPA